LGRFLGRDPLEYVDGMNLSVFTKSNSINSLDIFGLETIEEARLRRIDRIKEYFSFLEEKDYEIFDNGSTMFGFEVRWGKDWYETKNGVINLWREANNRLNHEQKLKDAKIFKAIRDRHEREVANNNKQLTEMGECLKDYIDISFYSAKLEIDTYHHDFILFSMYKGYPFDVKDKDYAIQKEFSYTGLNYANIKKRPLHLRIGWNDKVTDEIRQKYIKSGFRFQMELLGDIGSGKNLKIYSYMFPSLQKTWAPFHAYMGGTLSIDPEKRFCSSYSNSLTFWSNYTPPNSTIIPIGLSYLIANDIVKNVRVRVFMGNTTIYESKLD